MKYRAYSIAVILGALSASFTSVADTGSMEDCLLEAIKDANEEKTIGDIRQECSVQFGKEKEDQPINRSGNEEADQEFFDKNDAVAHSEPYEDPVARRIKLEEKTELNPFVLTPHKPTYFLPFSYNFDPNDEPVRSRFKGENIDNTEVKFQVSLKFPIWKGLYKDYGDLYIAYTNLSFWQAYNSDASSPFRETNHEPEIFFSFKNDWKIFGISNNVINLGLVHQSNGQSGSLSRSWNRVYANIVFQKDNFAVSLKPWLRISEDDEDDDNPDIEKYLGYGELRVGYKWGEHTFSSMFRNNFRSDNKGALELGWSFPMVNRIRGYVQYFYGYGESLIDYNESTNRLSIGIALTDWM